MIYLSVTTEIAPGKMAEFGEIASKELLPLYGKLGMKLVASWHGYTGNVNQIYSLYAWDDLSAYQKSLEAQQKDKDFQRVAVKRNALTVRQTYTLLEPNAWSPMK
jgi:hypothetical protein